MSGDANTPDRFTRAILEALKAETLAVVEQEAARAANRVRQRLRAMVGQIALEALLSYEVERQGTNLLIKVRIDPDSTAP